MAELKIFNDIQSEDTKNIVQYFGGVEGTSFKDIDEFIKTIPADDETIDIRLHCNGGEVLEGIAIYDKLRSTGKTISAVVEGTCASMATIILLAAQADKRNAYQNAEFLIHEPYMYFSTEHGTADELRKASEEMQRLEDKLTDIYVDRTDADRDTIIALMKDGKFISADKAQEIGLISTIIAPASAKYKPINNPIKTESDMSKETITVEKSWLQKALSFLGMTEKPLNMTLTTADGAELTVEREDGDPEVGDKASPDGTHTMADGKTIIVEDGVIVEIREKVEQVEGEPTADKTEDTKKGEASAEDVDTASLDAEINDLKAENAALRAKVEELTKELDTAKANAKSNDDLRILNAVKMAGGEKALAQFASHFVPEARKPQTDRVKDEASKKSVSKDDILAKLSSYKKK